MTLLECWKSEKNHLLSKTEWQIWGSGEIWRRQCGEGSVGVGIFTSLGGAGSRPPTAGYPLDFVYEALRAPLHNRTVTWSVYLIIRWDLKEGNLQSRERVRLCVSDFLWEATLISFPTVVLDHSRANHHLSFSNQGLIRKLSGLARVLNPSTAAYIRAFKPTQTASSREPPRIQFRQPFRKLPTQLSGKLLKVTFKKYLRGCTHISPLGTRLRYQLKP